MKPTEPHTGYGYIEADLSSNSARNKELYRVDSFHEKPKLELAKQYLAQNNYFWNAGIFIWSVETIVNAFRVYAPAMNKIFESMLSIYGTDKEQEEIDRRYPECEKISVDYAILEKAEEIFVCPADFGWSDLGSWDSLHAHTEHDLYKNSCIGPNIKVYDSRNCIVHTTEEKQVIVQGLDGYIVAESNNTLLVCKISEGQNIKKYLGEE
jgi:mannose-1-phosphate guanylyltransferase